MFKYILAFFILFSTLFATADYKQDFIEVDFDESMGKANPMEYHRYFMQPYSKARMDFFRDLYNKNKPSKKEYSIAPTIPKIIHQVWVGGAQIPPIYQYYQKTCQDLHPTWEYKLWTDKEVDAWDFENKDLYLATRNHAEKSDILRHQLLKDYGGVYIDLDIKCFKPLDSLHHLYDAYFGIEFPMEVWGSPIIAPGIMASAPNHKIVTNILKKIRSDWDVIEEKFDNGEFELDERGVHRLGIERSMKPVNEVFLETATLEDNVIALPPTYFYPIEHFAIDELYHKPLFERIKDSFFAFISSMLDITSSNKLVNWIYAKADKCCVFYDIKPETFSYHDYFEQNSALRYISFSDGFGLYDRQYSSFWKKLSNKDKLRFTSFKGLYTSNNPYGKIKFNATAKISSLIHFISLDRESVNKNIDSFKLNNPETTFTIWDREKIDAAFPGMLNKIPFFKTPDERDFYIATYIINNLGGIYINQYNLKSLNSLEELNNKYDLYAGLLPITDSNSKVLIDTNFIAAKPQHIILTNIIKNFDNAIEKGENIDVSEVATYNIYKYSALGGKNIILPPIYFHPLEKSVKETVLQRMKRFYHGYTRAFTKQDIKINFAVNSLSN